MLKIVQAGVSKKNILNASEYSKTLRLILKFLQKDNSLFDNFQL